MGSSCCGGRSGNASLLIHSCKRRHSEERGARNARPLLFPRDEESLLLYAKMPREILRFAQNDRTKLCARPLLETPGRHRCQMLNHGVTQMYLTRKIRRSRIFTGSAIISTRSRSVVTICSKVMRRKMRCAKLVEFITR